MNRDSGMMTGKNRLKIDVVFYILIFIAFYFLNRLSPFITDDYFYAFVLRNGSLTGESYEPISGLADVFRSQCYAYFHQNGRFVVHSIVQLFCGILGMESFVIINSLMFVLLVAGITQIVRYYRRPYTFDAVLVFVLLLLSIPIFGKTYLGNVSFSVNYLWTSTAIIWWLYLLICQKDNNVFLNIFLLLFSVLVGSMQESFSIGVAGALFVYYCFNYKEFKGSTVFLTLGFILGSCLVTFAPANFSRFVNEQGGTFNIKQVFLQIIRTFLSLRVFWLLLLCLLVLLIRKSKQDLKLIFKQHGVLILASCINVLFAAIIAMNGKHQMVCVELLSTIAVFSILTSVKVGIRHEKVILIFSILVPVFMYGPILKCRSEFHTAHQYLLESARAAKDGIVVGKEYERLCTEKSSWIADKYAMKDHYWSFNRYGLSLILSNGRDASQIKAVLPDTPEAIINQCVEANKLQNRIYKADGANYYILMMSESEINSAEVLLYHRPGRFGKLLYKLIKSGADPSNAKAISIEGCNKFYKGDYWYVIISDSSPIDMVRIVDIYSTEEC